MRARLFFFAAAAERAGKRSEDIDLPDGSKIADLEKFIARKFPTLGDLPLRFALNQQHALAGEPVNEGDEIAVFTPVSGG